MSPNTFVIVFAALVAAGCTTTQSQPPSLTKAETSRGCPLGVSGATVVAEDTADGIALSFRSPDRTEEMRERANDAASQHGPGQRLGRGHEGKHAEGGDHGLQMMQMPAARSGATDVEAGARIQFVAVDAADTAVLRAKLRERANAMNALSCK